MIRMFYFSTDISTIVRQEKLRRMDRAFGALPGAYTKTQEMQLVGAIRVFVAEANKRFPLDEPLSVKYDKDDEGDSVFIFPKYDKNPSRSALFKFAFVPWGRTEEFHFHYLIRMRVKAGFIDDELCDVKDGEIMPE